MGLAQSLSGGFLRSKRCVREELGNNEYIINLFFYSLLFYFDVRKILGLVALGSLIASPVSAAQSFSVVYPPANHQTTAQQIFFIGTAPLAGEVLVNGKQISRSRAGHFAPSFPLKLGDNIFTLRYQNQQIQIKVKRLSTAPEIPSGLAFTKDSLTPSVDIALVQGLPVANPSERLLDHHQGELYRFGQ